MYFISDDYQPRLGAVQDYEKESIVTDDYQDAVYSTARNLADANGYLTIADIGTGGGFKLLKYFKDFDTTGLDLPPTVAILNRRYPERKWVTEFSTPVDMVICSDVIEHVDDPDSLCDYIKSLSPKHAVISTPDRDLIHAGVPMGPPRNVCHVREWNYVEFMQYMYSHFIVEKFFYANEEQYTMCAVVSLRP